MIRFARISEINRSNVVLKLISQQRCHGCPEVCHKRLLALFNQDNSTLKVTRGKGRDASQLFDDFFFDDNHYVGQVVRISFNNEDMLKASYSLYLYPLLIFLLFLILGYLCFQFLGLSGDLGGVVGLLFGFFSANYFFPNRKNSPKVMFLS